MEYPRSSTCWKWVSWWRTSFSFRKSAAKLSGPCVNMYSESTNVLKVSLQLFLSKTANLTAQILFSSVNSDTTRRVCFSLTEISAFLRAARKYSSQFQSKCDQTKIFSQKSNSQHWSSDINVDQSKWLFFMPRKTRSSDINVDQSKWLFFMPRKTWSSEIEENYGLAVILWRRSKSYKKCVTGWR